MKLVKNILDSKGNEIWFITPDDSVLDAIKMMAEKQIGALLVMENEELVGILSERDYARKIILKGKSSRETPVKDIMTAEVVCAEPIHTVEQCMEIMTEKRIRHLPVRRWRKGRRRAFDRRFGQGDHCRTAIYDRTTGKLYRQLKFKKREGRKLWQKTQAKDTASVRLTNGRRLKIRKTING